MKESRLMTAFGLIVQSDLELPELPTATEKDVDVVIRYQSVPEHLADFTEKTLWYEVAGSKFLLRVDGVAKYYVEDGTTISIEPEQGVSEDLIRLFLYNPIFGRLLQQRNYLVLHGAVAVINGRAIALLGASTEGKSSVALKLYTRGHEVLADEICAISYREGKAYVFPEIARLTVWRDTLDAVGMDPDKYKPLRQDLEKYSIPVDDRFYGKEVELSGIVLLTRHNQNDIKFELIQGGNKLKKLVTFSEAPNMGQNNVKIFQTLAETGKARMIELSFNHKLHFLDEIADLIEKEWK